MAASAEIVAKELAYVKKFTVVLDIDDVLTRNLEPDPYELTEPPTDNERLYLLRKSAIFKCDGVEYLIFPGVLELMRYLCSLDIILAFFSAGIEERNVDFVKQLLIKALGEEKYRALQPKPIILSRHQLVDNKKDILAVLKELNGGEMPGEEEQARFLQSAVIVDDTIENITPDQTKNHISIHPCNISYDEIDPENWKELGFFRFNSVFHIAGMLAECLALFKSGVGFSSFLLGASYRPSKSLPGFFKYNYQSRWLLTDKYYDKGFEVLRAQNPNLSYVSFEDVDKVLKMPATLEERALLAPVDSEEEEELVNLSLCS